MNEIPISESKDFNCNDCGKCCIQGGHGTLSATDEDITRWEEEGREDILSRVDIFDFGDGKKTGDLWFYPYKHPTLGGDEMSKCPFLRKLPNQWKFKCMINDTKPATCRKYPIDKEDMENYDCEGFRNDENYKRK